jgi:aminoglycoside 6'-N-acetyltransferase
MTNPTDVTLRDFAPTTDLPRLAEWLQAPHVSPWWLDAERQLAAARERPAEGSHAIITADGEDVGYLRWQRVDREALAEIGLDDIPDGSIDLDILLGRPEDVGHGIGPRALALLLDRLFADPTVPLVGLVTSVRNHAALRAFAKAGFRRFREYDDPTYGRVLVLVVRAAPG